MIAQYYDSYSSGGSGQDFTWVFLLFLAFACAAIGVFIGKPKGRGSDGFALGLFLGPLGVLIAAVLKPSDEVRRAELEEQAAITAAAMAAATPTAPAPSGPPLRPCRWCAELIQPAAAICRFCQRPQPDRHPTG